MVYLIAVPPPTMPQVGDACTVLGAEKCLERLWVALSAEMSAEARPAPPRVEMSAGAPPSLRESEGGGMMRTAANRHS